MNSLEPPADIIAKMEAGLSEVESLIKADAPPEPAEAPPAEAAAAPVKTDEAAPKEPTSEVSSPSSTPAQRSKDYEDWLTKWGGPSRDPDVAARASWDMNNRLSQTAKPEQATETPAPPAKEPEPVVHPDVKRYDDTLRAIETQYARVKSDYEDTDKKSVEVAARIRAIERSRAFDDLDFEQDQALVKELRAKYAEQDRLQRSLDSLQGKAEILNDRYITQKNLKTQAETLAVLTQAREAEETERIRRQEDAALDNFTSTYFDQMAKVAKEGEQIPEELLEDWKTFAKKEAHIKLQVTDLPATDVPAFVQQVKADFLASIDRAHRSKSKVYAKDKTKDAEVNAPEGAAAIATTPNKTSGFRSQAEVDRFIEQASAGL